MKMNIFSAVLFLSLASLNLSCDNDSQVDDPNMVEYANPDENDQPINEEEDSHDADYKSFVMKAASEGMMEIELANIALEKSDNEEVRELAQMLKTEHLKANKELQEIMQINTWQMPEEMTDNDAVNVEQISTMPEEKFDMHYLHMVGNNHTKSIALFEEFANKPEKSDSAYADVSTTQADSGNNQNLEFLK